MNITKRVGALENQAGDGGFEKVHRIICKLGQTQDEAFDDDGRDKIEPKDLTIVRVLVTPRAHSGSDVEGKPSL